MKITKLTVSTGAGVKRQGRPQLQSYVMLKSTVSTGAGVARQG